MRPYLSLDIETTGLNRQKSEVLEIGFCYDDFKMPIDKLPKDNIIVNNPVYEYAETFALKMNARLIEAQNNKDILKYSVKDSFDRMFEATRFGAEYAANWDEAQTWKPTKRVCIAGKNASVFDVPVLTAYFLRKGITEQVLFEWQSYLHYKYIDVGSVYYSKFGYVPSLDEINKLTGRAEVTHMALGDAMDVVCAVRYSLGISYDNVIL